MAVIKFKYLDQAATIKRVKIMRTGMSEEQTALLAARFDAAIAGQTAALEGETPDLAEVVDARTGFDKDGASHDYDSLGGAIRSHFEILRNDLGVAVNGMSKMTQLPYVIGSDGKWTDSTTRHISVPINAGDIVKISATDDHLTVCGFLKSDNAASGVMADFCDNAGDETWQIRKIINSGESATYTAPQDCSILYVGIKASGDSYINPKTIEINDVNISSDLRTWISEIDNGLAGLEEDVDNVRTAISEQNDQVSELSISLEGISGLPQLPYTIGSNGKWTTVNSYHISVPINGGDVVVFTANASYDGVCAFLKSDNAAVGVVADFCADTGGETWTERKRVTKDMTVTYTAPSDCNILYVAAKPSNDNNLLPAKLIINGKDITINLHEAISEHDAEITTLIKKADTAEAENLATRRNLDIWGIRAMTDGEFEPVSMPSEFSYLEGYDLPLYTNGYKYIHKIDLSAYKNNSTNTVTVHNNTELQTALTNATAGDSIILDGGCYASITVDKSINLIGKNNPLFVNYLPGQFTTTTDPNTFKTVADFGYSATMILDITRLDDGVVIPMTQAGSIAACTSTPGSYIVSSNKLYVHMYEGRMPTERDIAVLGTNTQTIRLSGASAACKWYLEGLTVFGGKSCIFAFDSEDYGDQTVIGVDCKAYYSQTGDCIAMRGVDAFFQRCEATGAYLDGFNYHKRNPNDPTDHNISNGFEVDCIGHDNGKRQEDAAPSNNGTTIHDGGKIVRINGLYYNNNGGNVADASPDTESYNYGCIAFDSKAPYDTTDETSADYWARYANMYLYGCRALGDSQYNLRTYTAGTIYIDSKTEYDTNKTTGNIEPITS